MSTYRFIPSVLLLSAVGVGGCSLESEPTKVRIVSEQRFVVHVVKYPGETYTTLARWYTDSEKNGAALQKLNSSGARAALQIGQRVVIPTQLVRTLLPLPKTAIIKKDKQHIPAADTAPISTIDQIIEDLNVADSVAPSLPLPEQNAGAATSEVSPNPLYGVEGAGEGNEEPKDGVSIDQSGRSLEEILAEEAAELEKLRQEMN